MKSAILIQGLTGMGLVAYNIAKQLLEIPSLAFYEVKSYSEFFPNVAIVDNGRLSTQALRLYRTEFGERDDKYLYVLNGPQPGSDELQAMFMDKFTSDLLEIVNEDQEPIDLYISFGAFITSMQLPFLVDTSNFSTKDFIQKIKEKDRKLFVATCGGIDIEEFKGKLAQHECDLVREEDGYITGLNGVLPAVIGEKYGIPSVTIMVETETFEFLRATSHLSQFLGLLGTRKGIEFVVDAFDLGVSKSEVLDPINRILTELEPHAIRQIEKTLEQGKRERRDGLSPDHGKDYI
ncbi:MAG: PAC2 family protein [Candidatus Hodarchaeales archaeon]|jgi:proteasome assembly chaperone (PAC2) family protein